MLSSSLTTKHGFHTTYSTQIIVNDPANLARCTCHLLHILPPRVFVDPYELANYADFYTFKLSGNSNLELPVTAVDSKGSALLLNVLLPKIFLPGMQNVTVDVPLHLRYGEPVQLDAQDYGSVKVPWPTGFWVCPSSSYQSSHALPSMPVKLAASFDPLSSESIMMGMSGNSTSETVRASVGHLTDLKQVEVGTPAVILVVFLYLSHAVYRTASRISSRISSRNQRVKVE